MQGIVQDVLERKRTEFIGHLQMNKGFAFFVAEMDKPMPDIFIPLANLNNAIDNDRVVVRLLGWEKGGKRPLGEVVSVLDAENTNDAAMKEILLESGFLCNFLTRRLRSLREYPIRSVRRKSGGERICGRR